MFIRSSDYRGITINAYFFNEDRELAENYLAHTRRYLELYESLIGPFPYKTFSIVENNYQTGYSFPTYTLLGSQVIRLPFIVETSLAMRYFINGLEIMFMLTTEKATGLKGSPLILLTSGTAISRGRAQSTGKKYLPIT